MRKKRTPPKVSKFQPPTARMEAYLRRVGGGRGAGVPAAKRGGSSQAGIRAGAAALVAGETGMAVVPARRGTGPAARAQMGGRPEEVPRAPRDRKLVAGCDGERQHSRETVAEQHQRDPVTRHPVMPAGGDAAKRGRNEAGKGPASLHPPSQKDRSPRCPKEDHQQRQGSQHSGTGNPSNIKNGKQASAKLGPLGLPPQSKASAKSPKAVTPPKDQKGGALEEEGSWEEEMEEFRPLEEGDFSDESPGMGDCSAAGAQPDSKRLRLAGSPRRGTPTDSQSLQEELLRSIVRDLPSRRDMDDLFNQRFEAQSRELKTMLSVELKPMQETLARMAGKLEQFEAELLKIQEKVVRVETEVQIQQRSMIDMALKIMDLENRERRGNIRFRGVPENIPQEALKDKISVICNYYLDRPADGTIEVDRVHRVAGPRNSSSSRPRDVLCRFHYYVDREAILQAAWSKGPFLLDGAQITLLQDLAGRTLAMRRTMKPMLEVIRQKGATYRWGFPFSLIIRKDGRVFSLKSPEQLPRAFSFLDAQPVDVGDWYQVLQEV